MAAKRAKEPAVISLSLITSALEDVASEHTVESSIPRPAVVLAEAKELRLSFRNILRIENLLLLKTLRKLQLDNNALTRIEGLESLKQLEWLDLSFNKIKDIENLTPLTNLRDISLYNNEITEFKGLDTLPNLQVISLGNNFVGGGLESILYFRKCPALEVLCLEGNPLCRPPEGAGSGAKEAYRTFVHAFLPRLKYLDYQLITPGERAAARDGGVPAEKLQEVEEKDAQEERTRRKMKERQEVVSALAAANIEVIETMVDELFDDDPDFSKVRGLQGVAPLIVGMREALAEPAAFLKTIGLEKDGLIRAEIEQFQEAYDTTVGDALQVTSSRLQEWERALKIAAREHAAALEADEEDDGGRESVLTTGSNAGSSGSGGGAMIGNEDPIAVASQALKALSTEMEAFESWSLKLEMTTHDAVEAMLDVYDTAMIELKSAKVGNHEGFFRAAETAENVFTEGMVKVADRAISDAAAGHTPPDADDELLSLLGDKEALSGALAQAHEARVARILKRETDLKVREDKRCGGAVLSARTGELQRNRTRLLELRSIAKSCKKRVEEALNRTELYNK